MSFEKDQRVSFTRAHDRTHSLTGTVVEVKDDEVLVSTEPDGVLVWASAADVSAEEVSDAEEKGPQTKADEPTAEPEAE